MMCFLGLLRIKHYVKNILIAVPLVCSGTFGADAHRSTWLLLVAIASFCLISSSVYILNDVVDYEKDIKHPKKRMRPIARGIVGVPLALVLAMGLLAAAVALGVYVSLLSSWAALVVLVLYFAMNLSYSFFLKHVPVIEVAILASGFLLRVLFGGFATGIEVSSWLYLTVLSVSFYLGLGKRRNELDIHSVDITREVLKQYNRRFLDRNMYMFLALSICFYSLWAMEQGHKALLSVPMVMILCMRYSLIVEGSSDGDPVDVILGDKFLLGLGAIYSVYMIAVFYVI